MVVEELLYESVRDHLDCVRPGRELGPHVVSGCVAASACVKGAASGRSVGMAVMARRVPRSVRISSLTRPCRKRCASAVAARAGAMVSIVKVGSVVLVRRPAKFGESGSAGR